MPLSMTRPKAHLLPRRNPSARRANCRKLPEGLTLIPGMPVEAFIRTDDRTPLAYLVKPLTDYFNKAFRES